jgi:type I restriction enzyme, S subunit
MKTRKVQLGTVCEFIRGVTFDKADVTTRPEVGKTPVLRAGNIREELDAQNDLVWVPDARVSDEQRLRQNDIAICMSSGSPEVVGKTARVPCDLRASIGSFCGIIRPKSLDEASYLSFFFRSAAFRRHRNAIARGANIQNLRFSQFEEIELEIPIEHRQIAEPLEQADRLRRTRRYALELSDTVLPATFLELFGDPFAVRSAELTRLEDVLEVGPQNGLYVPADRYVGNGDSKGTEMVHMSDLFGGMVTPGNLKRALLETSEVAKYQLSERDLLIARRSLAYEGAAQPCRVPTLKAPLVFESSMIRIRPDTSRMLAVYLYYYLTNRAVRENRVRRYVTISTISGINQDNLCRIEVVVPPLTLQQKFAALVERVERLRVVQREALRQAEHLFASLLHRAFSSDSPSLPGNFVPGN